MITTSDQLGAHLDAWGASRVVVIPADGGGDYLAATVQGRTVEVWYEGGRFARALMAGAGGCEAFTDLDALLKELDMGGDVGEAMVPEVRYDPRGRIPAPPVVVGDVWGCYSLREMGRTFRITEVTDTHAYGVVLTDSGEVQRCLILNRRAVAEGRPEGLPYPYTRTRVGSMCQVRLDRMRPTCDGYYRLTGGR